MFTVRREEPQGREVRSVHDAVQKPGRPQDLGKPLTGLLFINSVHSLGATTVALLLLDVQDAIGRHHPPATQKPGIDCPF